MPGKLQGYLYLEQISKSALLSIFYLMVFQLWSVKLNPQYTKYTDKRTFYTLNP